MFTNRWNLWYFLYMAASFEESPTKQKILTLLKKSEWMTVSELSKQMGITPMAVRQHLMALEKKGIIHYEVKKYGIGRPVFLYKLTDKAHNLFPAAYGKFLNEMFQALEELDGKKKIDRLFQFRKERLLEQKRRDTAGCRTLGEKVATLTEELNREGYMAELAETDEGFVLKQFNCPIRGVAAEYDQPCRYELELYRDLFEQDVTRLMCQQLGDPSCTYLIPRA